MCTLINFAIDKLQLPATLDDVSSARVAIERMIGPGRAIPSMWLKDYVEDCDLSQHILLPYDNLHSRLQELIGLKAPMSRANSNSRRVSRDRIPDILATLGFQKDFEEELALFLQWS